MCGTGEGLASLELTWPVPGTGDSARPDPDPNLDQNLGYVTAGPMSATAVGCTFQKSLLHAAFNTQIPKKFPPWPFLDTDLIYND